MHIAKISLFDKICIASEPIAKIFTMKYKLLKALMHIAKISLLDKICIAAGPGANANCKNTYDEI